MATPALSQTSPANTDWRIPVTEPSSSFWFGKVHEWLNENGPCIVKIGQVFLAFLGAAALCATLVGIPILIYSVYEYNRRLEVEEKAVKLMQEQLQPRLDNGSLTIPQALTQALEGKNIPTLNLRADQIGSTQYLDQLNPEDLSSDIMQGTDPLNRRFYAFRVKDKSDGETKVFTVFQRHTGVSEIWTFGANRGRPIHASTVRAPEIVKIYQLANQQSTLCELV
jgi:hypothetical protein